MGCINMTAKLMRSTFNDSFIIMSLLCKVLGYIMQLFFFKKDLLYFTVLNILKQKKSIDEQFDLYKFKYINQRKHVCTFYV